MDFNFIIDREFRQILSRDYDELQKCFEAQNLKSVLILSGSIIESILSDYLVNIGNIENNVVLQFTFNELIQHELIQNALSKQSIQTSIVIKDYRNLIHPGREIRKNQKFDENSAQIAYALLNLIIKEIREKYSENEGYSAELVIKKLECDFISNKLFENILKKMSKHEKLNLFHQLMNYTTIYGSNLDEPKIYLEKLKPHINKSDIEIHIKKMVENVNTSNPDYIIFYFLRLDVFFDYLKIDEFKHITEYISSLIIRKIYNDKEPFSIYDNEICISFAKCYLNFDIDESIVNVFVALIRKYLWTFEVKYADMFLMAYDFILAELSGEKQIDILDKLKLNLKPVDFEKFQMEREEKIVPF